MGPPCLPPHKPNPPTVGVVSPVCNKKNRILGIIYGKLRWGGHVYTEKDLRPSCLTRGGRRDKLIWDFVCRAILISWTFNTGPQKESKWPIFKGEKLMVLNLFGRRSRPNFSIGSRERLFLSSAVTISRCPKKMGWLDPHKRKKEKKKTPIIRMGGEMEKWREIPFHPFSFSHQIRRETLCSYRSFVTPLQPKKTSGLLPFPCVDRERLFPLSNPSHLSFLRSARRHIRHSRKRGRET